MAEKNDHNEELLYRLRHSTAHVMAQAVLEMFPEGKTAIGPPIEDGFYYDFDLPRSLTPEDLEAIEQRMRKVISGNHPFVRRDMSAEDARALYADQPYKLELIDGIVAGGVDEYGDKVEGDVVLSTYKHDTFEDLCRGPHVDSTGQIPRQESLQASESGRGLLARRRAPPDAAAHLRHGLAQQGRVGWLSPQAG
jgi:threonyl-tRNA synthetase